MDLQNHPNNDTKISRLESLIDFSSERRAALFNICPQCGESCVEKEIDPAGPFAICPFCHYAHPFLQQPLFVVTGASGAGKSTACLRLIPMLQEYVVMEADILWGVFAPAEGNDFSIYRNLWLRVAKNIGQAGRPVVLCGTALPEQLETCPERRYFSTISYLALVCDEALLQERLKQRPAWRGSGTDEVVGQMVRFNRWLKVHAATTNPPMTLLESSHQGIQETVEEIARWVRVCLPR
jgi:predicted ABC-type ATPase